MEITGYIYNITIDASVIIFFIIIDIYWWYYKNIRTHVLDRTASLLMWDFKKEIFCMINRIVESLITVIVSCHRALS